MMLGGWEGGPDTFVSWVCCLGKNRRGMFGNERGAGNSWVFFFELIFRSKVDGGFALDHSLGFFLLLLLRWKV